MHNGEARASFSLPPSLPPPPSAPDPAPANKLGYGRAVAACPPLQCVCVRAHASVNVCMSVLFARAHVNACVDACLRACEYLRACVRACACCLADPICIDDWVSKTSRMARLLCHGNKREKKVLKRQLLAPFAHSLPPPLLPKQTSFPFLNHNFLAEHVAKPIVVSKDITYHIFIRLAAVSSSTNSLSPTPQLNKRSQCTTCM